MSKFSSIRHVLEAAIDRDQSKLVNRAKNSARTARRAAAKGHLATAKFAEVLLFGVSHFVYCEDLLDLTFEVEMILGDHFSRVLRSDFSDRVIFHDGVPAGIPEICVVRSFDNVDISQDRPLYLRPAFPGIVRKACLVHLEEIGSL